MYSKLLKNILYPSYDLWRGNTTIKNLNELNKSQWFSLKHLQEIQLKRLKSLIRHAYNNVPYYHKIFRQAGLFPDDIKTTDDLIKLPVLTKDIVKNNFNSLIAQNHHDLKGQKPIPYTTGGSTGEPFKFCVTKEMLSWGSAAAYRAWEWCDFQIGDKNALLWGSSFDVSKHHKLQNRILNIFKRRMFLDTFNMSEKDMEGYVHKIQRFKPDVLRAYAPSAYLLAKYIEHNNIDIKFKAVVTTAETLFKYQRDTIEHAFNCDVFDGYGSRETSLIAHECKEHMGYHVSIENSVLEFVKNNEHVSGGELGEILITDLHNYAMPFLRYQIGDAGKPSDELCSCGRGLPLIDSVEGRIQDIIVTPDGKYVPGDFFDLLFEGIDSIKKYQIIQKTKYDLLIKIATYENFTQANLDFVYRNVRRYFGDEINIDIIFVDSIKTPLSGKRKVTISNVPIKFH